MSSLTVFGLLLVLVVGCENGVDDGPAQSPSTPLVADSASPSTSTAAAATPDGATPSPSDVVVASVEPAVVLPQASWEVARYDIVNPDGLAAIPGAVFVKTDDGDVVRIDTRTDTVTTTVRLDTATDPGRYCLGVGSDGETLWACLAGESTTDVSQLNPETLDVIATVGVDKLFDQLSLPVAGGRLWVLTGSGDQLSAVDTTTHEVTTVPLSRRCFQIAATAQVVYATCLSTDEVIAVDAGTGQVLTTTTVDAPSNVSAFGDDVWVSGSAGITRMTADLRPRVIYPGLTAGGAGDLVATADAIWVRQPRGFLFRIDPATNTVAAQFAIDPAHSGGGLIVTDDGVFTAASEDQRVFRIDPFPDPGQPRAGG